jgi:hypothetical protein
MELCALAHDKRNRSFSSPKRKSFTKPHQAKKTKEIARSNKAETTTLSNAKTHYKLPIKPIHQATNQGLV